MMKRIAFLFVGTFLLANCGYSVFGGGDSGPYSGPPRGMHGDPSGTAAGITQMRRFDANKDGMVTRAELDGALKTDFAALDKNHDGKLDGEEVRAENDRRYGESGTQYSPLLDWNQDGVIGFGEFANAPRSLFEQLDEDHDSVLSPSELKPPRGPKLEDERRPTPVPRSNVRGA